jgi:hypothetical protein
MDVPFFFPSPAQHRRCDQPEDLPAACDVYEKNPCLDHELAFDAFETSTVARQVPDFPKRNAFTRFFGREMERSTLDFPKPVS